MDQAYTISIGIATRGRSQILQQTLRHLLKQMRAADEILVCGSEPDDIGDVPTGVITLVAPAGACTQRNAIIRACTSDTLVFFDDDFIPEPCYLAMVERHMIRSPTTAVFTGLVLADGAQGAGLTREEGERLLMSDHPHKFGTVPTFSAYGCNMGVNMAILRASGEYFDDRLPLYSWQEDVDLSRRLAPYGDVVQLLSAEGVHLGTKRGRTSGIRFGYSQIANPIYLARKHRGYPRRYAIRQLSRNVAKNLALSIWPEKHVDRRGRLWGNALAFWDLLRGKMQPERVLSL